MKASKRFQRMCVVYKIFARHWLHVLDFSDEMAAELYKAETFGGRVSAKNGFSVGKMYLNAHVKMWKEDVAAGNLKVFELRRDPLFPTWWIDSIFKRVGS